MEIGDKYHSGFHQFLNYFHSFPLIKQPNKILHITSLMPCLVEERNRMDENKRVNRKRWEIKWKLEIFGWRKIEKWVEIGEKYLWIPPFLKLFPLSFPLTKQPNLVPSSLPPPISLIKQVVRGAWENVYYNLIEIYLILK